MVEDTARSLVGRDVTVKCKDGTKISGVLDQVSASGAVLLVTPANGEVVVRVWDIRRIDTDGQVRS